MNFLSLLTLILFFAKRYSPSCNTRVVLQDAARIAAAMAENIIAPFFICRNFCWHVAIVGTCIRQIIQIYEKLRVEAKFTLLLPKRISICAQSANIAKVESRGKIYFHYAETKHIYEL